MTIKCKYSTRVTILYIYIYKYVCVCVNIKTAGVLLDYEGHKINAKTFKARIFLI